MSARTKTPAMWERLVGQERAVGLLRGAVESGTVGHAYLFVGPQGVGRELAALALAASPNCPEGGCGACTVCERVLRRAHPDVITVAPEGAQILVEQVREVRALAHRSPFEGKTKVVIFEDAHRLNPAAANALLKVLEEPPGDVVFLLVTGSPEDVPETIVSRARRVDFFPLGPAAIATVLTDQHDVDEQTAEWAARTGGDLSTALRFVKDDAAPSRRAGHLELPGRLVRGGPGEALRAAAEITKEADAAAAALGARHKEELARAVEAFGEGRGSSAVRKRIEDRHKREQRRRTTEAYDSALRDLQSFYRDVLLLGAGVSEEQLVNREIAERLARAAGVADPAWLTWALLRIEETRRALERNVVPQLALEALFMELGTPRARAAARA
ncbi:MAG: DNA polymerase III subunit delta' [Actinomycetota bacterium]